MAAEKITDFMVELIWFVGGLCTVCDITAEGAGIRRRMVLSNTQNVDIVKNNNVHSQQQ
jgi:hypothetical protein